MKILRWFLFPFSQLYVLVMAIRNFMFDIGFYQQARFPVKIISVGNLSTGGTGKTPFIEHLIEIIPEEKSIAVLSRGYGRRTKGFLLANEQASPEHLGDEPFQLWNKYKGRVTVAVAEKRKTGVANLLQLKNKPDIVLLDDAFQHRWVSRDLNILLTSYEMPFFKDLTLPTGNLRETRFEARRADMVVVTKCPSLYPEDKAVYTKRINRLTRGAGLLFSTIAHDTVKPVFGQSNLRSDEVVLITGIANPKPLLKHLNEHYLVVEHFAYKDHHAFTKSDLDALNVKLSENSNPLITTEKDMVRLLAFKDHELFKQHELFYVPMGMLVDDSQLLRQQVMKLLL